MSIESRKEKEEEEEEEECPAGPNWCISTEKGNHTPCRQSSEARKRWLKQVHLQSEAAKGVYLKSLVDKNSEERQ